MDRTRPTILGALVALVVGTLIMGGVAEVILRLLMPHWNEFHSGHFIERTTVPGFRTVAIGRAGFDGHFAQNNGDFRHRIRINAFGLRNADPVSAAHERVWVVGDSMAFGWGVERDQTYTAILARESATGTYNVASPGTDVCGYQALVARMPEGLSPRAVVIGLILENDIADYDCAPKPAATKPEKGKSSSISLKSIKEGLTGHSALYNFLAVAVKRVDVLSEALVAVGLIEGVHKEKHLFPPAEMVTRVRRTAEELAELAAMLPPAVPMAVLIAPARFEIRDDHPFYRDLRLSMVDALNRRGIQVIDPIAQFKEAGFAPTHFSHDGHWSPLGHEIAGKAAAKWVKENLATK